MSKRLFAFFPTKKRVPALLSKDNKSSFELSVLLEEYKSLREEIISLQGFTRESITTTYAGIGVIGALSPLIVSSGFQILFLFFPFFFYGLALTSTKYALAGLHIGNYIKTVLTPNIQLCLSQENKERDYSHILSWEKSKGVVRKYGILFLPANGAHYWIPLLAALISIAAYFAFPPTNPPPFAFLIIFLCINLLVLIYTMGVGLYAGLKR